MSGKTISRNQRQNPTPSTPMRKFSNSNSVFSIGPRAASTRSPYIRAINSLKNLPESGLTNSQVGSRPVAIYQPWKSDYLHSVKRPKSLKPMVKDSYAPNSNVITQVKSTIVNETNLPLIPFSAVKIEQTVIEVHTRKKKPMIVRYLRRHEVLPSVPRTSSVLAKDVLIDNLVNHHTASPSPPTPVQKSTPATPKLTPVERLLYRDKLRNDPFPVRRPTRKVTFNLSRETIMPFTECS